MERNDPAMNPCKRIAVLVTGSRGWTDQGAIMSRLRTYAVNPRAANDGAPWCPPDSVLIQGGASGADALSTSAVHYGWMIETTRYFDWLGKRGGHVRNAMMLDKLKVYAKYGYRCSVEAFSLGTSGTEGMIQLAQKAGFAVHITRGTP
jgi:hypothetical protein